MSTTIEENKSLSFSIQEMTLTKETSGNRFIDELVGADFINKRTQIRLYSKYFCQDLYLRKKQSPSGLGRRETRENFGPYLKDQFK